MGTEVTSPARQTHSATPLPPSDVSSSRKTMVLDTLILIAEEKRIVFYTTIGFALLSAAISLVLPLRYTASTVVLPPQQNSSMSSALAAQLGNLGGMASMAGGSLGLKSPNEMFAAMLKSRTVEEAMVQRYGLMQEYHAKIVSDARKVFERRTTVDASGKDGLIRISIQDRDPNRAAELANGYVDQFRQLSEHLAITEASQRRLFFERQLEASKDNLAKAEEELKRTEQNTGMIQLDSQARALIETAATVRAQISAKEVEIRSLQTFATDQNAQLVQAQQELAGLRSQLGQLGGSSDEGGGGVLVPKGRVPQAGLEYVRKLRDVRYNETVFEILARQFEAAKLDEAKQGALIQVVDTAVPPDRRSFPKRWLIVIVSTFVGAIIGIVIVLCRAGMRRLREDPETGYRLNALTRALSLKSR
jgi:tyrosine-protein kinase Etk/Wzc